MICILGNIDDPYFNLAAEEYLLKNTDEEVFILWRCDSTIVVGKHQNTLAEINYRYVKENDIKVARRLSGGGTVFHDKGNVNFTFIRNGEIGKLVDYKRHVTPVIDILKEMGINAQPGKKNEIFLEGKKISGNAEHIYQSRILHHGTLLFDSELDKLHNAIQATPGKYHDKAVQSYRSKVTNILPYLHEKIPVEEFMNHLFDGFINNTADACQYHFSKSDLLSVNHLVQQKYNTWEWIYGYSPKYRFENRLRLEGREISMMLNVENGIIKSAAITGDFFTVHQKNLLADSLINQKHSESQIRKIIESALQNRLNVGMIEEIVEAFF
ncbi:MAG TPA: lipoate--protein ligase [Bacteroidales bacterium]|nr:lipoate--protein ligase [Bacteroidales bacterium]